MMNSQSVPILRIPAEPQCSAGIVHYCALPWSGKDSKCMSGNGGILISRDGSAIRSVRRRLRKYWEDEIPRDNCQITNKFQLLSRKFTVKFSIPMCIAEVGLICGGGVLGNPCSRLFFSLFDVMIAVMVAAIGMIVRLVC